MNYSEKIISHKHLQKDVLCYWQMNGNITSTKNIYSRHIPKGQSLLVFNFGNEVKLINHTKKNILNKPYFVVPAVASCQIINQTGKINLFGISFIGDGLYKLIKHPITKLSENFPQLLKQDYQALYSRLKDLDFYNKADLTNDFLLKNLDQKKNNKAFSQAVTKINKTKGKMKVSVLIDELQVSKRHLQRLFKNRMGISPKQYCKIVRVNSYLEFIFEKGNSIDWMDLVVEFDYHDQSHLINEVKSLSQLSPQRLLNYRDTLYHRYYSD